jgi:uncharacterized protein (TIGR03437 family)
MLTLACGAFCSVLAQTASATPDAFAAQLTSSPASSSAFAFRSTATDISANGRFVVFESNGDVATERTTARNNADGNIEIFLADYAQRRIFQLTNTKNVPKPAASPTPTPTPSASPTPTPGPAPADLTQVQIEIANKGPMISLAPAASSTGGRVYTIVFRSNAPNPANFDGVDTGGALAADGNMELWTYQLPEVIDNVDLSTGVDLPLQDLSAGTFGRLTNTPASRLPTAGGAGVLPFVADDNRDETISDNGAIIAFVSTRNLVPAVGNADGNPELFFFNRNTATFVQATNTQGTVPGLGLIFQQNPSLSSDGSVVAFISSANLTGNNGDNNGEIFVADFNGTVISNLRQATRTQRDVTAQTVNLMSSGRRLSRNGALIAFESLANDPKGNSTTNASFLAVFVYTIGSDTFTQVGNRALTSPGDIIHFPAFTDYNSSLAPSTLVFASALNFRPDGSFPPMAEDSTGLNPSRVPQLFSTTVPVGTTNTFTRLTQTPNNALLSILQALTTDTRKRIAFSAGAVDLGGGNPDGSNEVFYFLSPTITTESTAALTFATGASNFPVPTITPSPSPSPTPTPSPGTQAAGLAPGELSIVRASVPLAPAAGTTSGGSETGRSPALPIELNGVSLAVNGAAAGLYFVGNSPGQINFVVPIGLAAGTGAVAINNNGTVFRNFFSIAAAQPDIFTSSNEAGGRAAVVNVTNPLNRMPEPFPVRSLNQNGELVATVLEMSLTGVRSGVTSEVTVTVGTATPTTITGAAITFIGPNRDMPGFDLLRFTLPESLAGAGDVPITVTIARSGGTFTSRAAATAPHITISQ